MADWIPMVDVSRWQGTIDWRKMTGVVGAYIRAGNGTTPDARFKENVAGARAVGIKVGAYQFVNPKQANASQHAQALARWIAEVGGMDIPPHADVEWYTNEPGPGPVLPRAQMNAWLQEYLNLTAFLVGRVPVIYTSAAYWDSAVGPIPNQGFYDFIIPRYPVYSPSGYQKHPVYYPPSRWDEWAFERQPAGPKLPAGCNDWEAWQFSAGYNGQGPVYGAQSSDLDLNIVRADAWDRWITGDEPMATVQHYSLASIEGDGRVWAVASNRQGRIHIPNPTVLQQDQFLMQLVGLDPKVNVLPRDWTGWLDSFPISGQLTPEGLAQATSAVTAGVTPSVVAAVGEAVRGALAGLDPDLIEGAVARAVTQATAALAAQVAACLSP